ncbi:MAG: ABC transporter substrate-binding protein [Proteobacteria bacterium]|nr:ABC transporter substrate-binding protein [Pseudomonadota bacterium]MBU1581238.1 ABC transporter substrate-binding protein [Pseudomonadota bacterium]MBU2454013.1 ABC transporter substrate-binding protein [Pseudomonadota bacterium]MBU2627807.1 ABC transporter substrate-binding protein [Pseudomonadota bacterium]
MKKGLMLALFVSLAFLLSVVPTVCAEEGVTDTEIHIGQWGPQTGPAAAWGSVARGTGAYFQWINDNGGIHGRKIVYHMFDDGYNPAKTKAGVKELQEGTGIFAWASGVGTTPGLAVRDYLAKKNVPWIGPSAGSLHWVNPPQKNLFAVYPLYAGEAKALVKYAIEKMGKKRVAIAYLNDEYGKNGLRGAQAELKAHGLKPAVEVSFEAKDSDLQPHVMKIRKSNADMVLLWTTVPQAAKVVGMCKAMKFDTQFMSTSTCSDFPLMTYITKGAWEGVICATFGESPDSGHPGIEKYKTEVFDKYAPKEERWGLFYYAGILFVEPMIEGLKMTGRDLTRENFISAMEQIKGFKGIGPEVNFKPYNKNDMYSRQGTNQTFLVKCLAGGKAEKLTEWMDME